jgi:hypothetical protein
MRFKRMGHGPRVLTSTRLILSWPCPLSSNRPPWENNDLSKQVVLLTSYHGNMVKYGGTLSYLRLLKQGWHR